MCLGMDRLYRLLVPPDAKVKLVFFGRYRLIQQAAELFVRSKKYPDSTPINRGTARTYVVRRQVSY